MLTDQYIILFRQILSGASYPSAINTLEADHLINVLKMNMNPVIVHTMENSFCMYKTCDFKAFMTLVKEMGKLMESHYEGRVPPILGATLCPTTTFTL